VSDTERFDERRRLWGQPLYIIYPSDRHRQEFLECAIALRAHGLIARAAIYISAPAGIAGPAIEIRIACYDHPFFQAAIVRADFDDPG